MAEMCSNCGRDPGDGYRCRHCGEMQYRYAIESDDWEESHPELEDEEGWDDPPEGPAWTDDDPPPLEAIVEELRGRAPDPEPEDEEPFFVNQPMRAPEPIEPTAVQSPTRSGCRGCLIVVVVIGIVLVGLGVLFALFFGDVIESGSDGGSVEVTGEAGECLLLDSDGSTVLGSTSVPCDEPHDAEIYLTSTFPEGPFPGDASLAGDADDVCWDAFEGYVGTPYVESIYYYDWLVPTEASWADGDRELLCAIVSGDGSRLVGSAFASGR